MEKIIEFNNFMQIIVKNCTDITESFMLIFIIMATAILIFIMIILPLLVMYNIVYMEINDFIKEKTNKTIKENLKILLRKMKERIKE